jgi:uncharacterized protein
MKLLDVNVLVYAYRREAPRHSEYHHWLETLTNSDQAYGCSELVLSGFLRVVTHPRIFSTPTPVSEALAFARLLRERPNAVVIGPGPRHWDIFARLCQTTGVKGNLVPDAYFAALALESGSEWLTTDRDYSRFPGLKWRHPLDA